MKTAIEVLTEKCTCPTFEDSEKAENLEWELERIQSAVFFADDWPDPVEVDYQPYTELVEAANIIGKRVWHMLKLMGGDIGPNCTVHNNRYTGD